MRVLAVQEIAVAGDQVIRAAVVAHETLVNIADGP
jgi:hypothetical protein